MQLIKKTLLIFLLIILSHSQVLSMPPKNANNGNGMFSKLVFNVNGTVVEFSANELIGIAMEIVEEKQESLTEDLISMPDRETIGRELDEYFWSVTKEFAGNLAPVDGYDKEAIFSLLKTLYDGDEHDVFRSLFTPNNKAETPCFSPGNNKHMLFPIEPFKPSSIKQWMFMSKYLKKSEERLGENLVGWWFNVGGRIVRLRNDVNNGEVRKDNKHLYAADHGLESDIYENMFQRIYESIKDLKLLDDIDVFNFFRNTHFLLDLNKYKADLSRIEDDFIRFATGDSDKDRELFKSLARNGHDEYSKLMDHYYENSPFEKTDFTNAFNSYQKNNWDRNPIFYDKGWLENRFNCKGKGNESEEELEKLIGECVEEYKKFFGKSSEEVKDECEDVKKGRKKYIDYKDKFKSLLRKLGNEYLEFVREKFIVAMVNHNGDSSDEIRSTLISLAPSSEKGTSDRRGERLLQGIAEELEGRSNVEDSEGDIEKYGAIFDETMELFRYIMEAKLGKQVLLERGLPFFHKQIARIAHEQDANDYMVFHILIELAKEVNRGRQKPLLRAKTAYGDGEAGNSYQKFEPQISGYLKNSDGLDEIGLAKKMRELLESKEINDEDLCFLPSLAAAWFLSEAARNPLTTMTTLMLLDMLESEVYFPIDNSKDPSAGNNWYSWRHALMHPQTETGQGKTKDAYGVRVDRITEFGGCHPMTHTGSYLQTQELPEPNQPLNIARQKEGHLIIHWLQLMIDSFSQEVKNKYGLHKIDAKTMRNNDVQKELNLDKTDEKNKKSQKLNKLQGTIRKKQAEQLDVSKQEKKVNSLEKDIAKLDEQIKAKETILEKIIKPLLRSRISGFRNFLPTDLSTVGGEQDLYSDDYILNLLQLYLLGDDRFLIIDPAAVIFEDDQLLTGAVDRALSAVHDGRVVVMPIHLHGNHWVGAVFRMQTNGAIQIIYNDPLGNRIEDEPNAALFVQAIQQGAEIFTPGRPPEIIDLRLRQQTNGRDCGPFTVDNLVRLARNAADLDNLDREGIVAREILQQPITGNADDIRREHDNIRREMYLNTDLAQTIREARPNLSTIPIWSTKYGNILVNGKPATLHVVSSNLK